MDPGLAQSHSFIADYRPTHRACLWRDAGDRFLCDASAKRNEPHYSTPASK
jgi:hypothetical protein